MIARIRRSMGNANLALAAALCVTASANASESELVIPTVAQTEKRAVTVDDIVAVRSIDSLSVSPDGRRFAIFVRQSDPLTNQFRTAWYVAAAQGHELIRVGDGGALGPRVMFTGHMPGAVGGGESRWSPDGQWIAYTLQRDGEVQLWRSRADGSLQEKLTSNVADVREFAWSDDGRAIYFTVGTPRAELRNREQARDWDGYRYDEDLWLFTDFMGPGLIRPPETSPSVWHVTLNDRKEGLAEGIDRAAFDRMRRARATNLSAGSELAGCAAEECSGAIQKVWRSAGRLLFWRHEGINDTAQGLYSWDPAKRKLSVIARMRDDKLQFCSLAHGDRLICVRESAERPAHVVSIDTRSGRTQGVAEVNPEFVNFRLGRVERFEWDNPRFPWNEPGGALEGLYPKRAYGYVLYPPDFDPAKKYPVFIDPYVAQGFSPLGGEHALHAYAASGFVVLRMAYPLPMERAARGGAVDMKELYSPELGFPHLTMLMESTVRGLDVAAEKGFIDTTRVGIGGVSHGTFVPLYMMQKHDRIAAISISSATWGPIQYYSSTQKPDREMAALGFKPSNWVRKPDEAGREFWKQIDIAEHVDKIEAPILMHLAAYETFALLPLIRHMGEAKKPYDAYVFSGEAHIKWQPAHLHAIMRRNLDWFRYWLQGYEDPDTARREQYLKWRALKGAGD